MNELSGLVSVGFFFAKIIYLLQESVYNVLLCFYGFLTLITLGLQAGISIWFIYISWCGRLVVSYVG